MNTAAATDSHMTTYGRKGGEGPTAGRKAETIYADIAGERFLKRVFFGQRFLAICHREEWNERGIGPIVTAWHTQEEAERMDEAYRKDGCEFHAWAPARVI